MKGPCEGLGNREQGIEGKCCAELWFVATSVFLILVMLAQGAWAQQKINPYDDTMKRVRLLSESPNVRLLSFGRSSNGRQIPAFVISDFSLDPTRKARIFLCAGQHGDEYSPIRSLLEISRNIAAGERPDLLAKCAIVVVPMVNPDGVALDIRENGQGADVNRDWMERWTPETQYVHSLISTWQPQVMIDLHEWTGPSPVPGNELELARCISHRQRAAMGWLASDTARRAKLSLIRCSVRGDGRLFHRKYSMQGYATYLVETAPGMSEADKNRTYTTAVESMTSALAADYRLRSSLSPGSADFDVSRVNAYLEPSPIGAFSDPAYSTLWLAGAFAIGYCMLIWLMKPQSDKNEIWSRKFRKCSVDAEIAMYPLLKRRGLQPLTSKSWVHRRLRSKYATAAKSTRKQEDQGSLEPSHIVSVPNKDHAAQLISDLPAR